ncbi:hypothetical protein JOQ06_026743 [Pogonophryne albipinna]|uniref:Muscarinic acetylcholine receptor n=1 Tax=Pogonophryne albipinna TaxID=1090488 RepID=A0AAD6BAQ0_9TELE|nr:hypothetical protein JOQ06_026743 [Pogonophryne albipinna]
MYVTSNIMSKSWVPDTAHQDLAWETEYLYDLFVSVKECSPANPSVLQKDTSELKTLPEEICPSVIINLTSSSDSPHFLTTMNEPAILGGSYQGLAILSDSVGGWKQHNVSHLSGPERNYTDSPGNPTLMLPAEEFDPLGGHTVLQVLVIVFLTGSLSIVTVVGNILVMVSFKINKALKTVNNYYLLSLAFADLTIGTLSMNLYTTYIIMNQWALGPVVCDLWLAIDYVASNASVMNLLVISFDRYFSVTRPLTYRAKRTTKRAMTMIGLAWSISFILWAPAILFWQYIVGRHAFKRSVNTTITTVGEAEQSSSESLNIEAGGSGDQSGSDDEAEGGKESRKGKNNKDKQSSSNKGRKESQTNPASQSPAAITMKDAAMAKRFASKAKTEINKRKNEKKANENKAARTLSAILVVFITTWLPYNIMVLVSTFCTNCIPETLWSLGYWLCYVNSTINPICYALCNKTFRTTFRDILMCQWNQKKNQPTFQQRKALALKKKDPI